MGDDQWEIDVEDCDNCNGRVEIGRLRAENDRLRAALDDRPGSAPDKMVCPYAGGKFEDGVLVGRHSPDCRCEEDGLIR